MFTGIIEEVGTILDIRKNAKSASILIGAETVLEDIKTGDSIAVNGICLTVTAYGEQEFTADIMHETLECSSIGRLMRGSHVNLERAMRADGRFGGHIVTGHVDGTGRILAVKRNEIAVWYTIEAEPELMTGIVKKGSIAIDGISLTVAKSQGRSFSVSIIPHTSGHTILSEKKVGDIVNLETDCIGKYVAHLLELEEQKQAGGISMPRLAELGFL